MSPARVALPTISAALAAEARGWLADCGHTGAYTVSLVEVFDVIERRHCGGVAEFIRNACL